MSVFPLRRNSVTSATIPGQLVSWLAITAPDGAGVAAGAEVVSGTGVAAGSETAAGSVEDAAASGGVSSAGFWQAASASRTEPRTRLLIRMLTLPWNKALGEPELRRCARLAKDIRRTGYNPPPWHCSGGNSA